MANARRFRWWGTPARRPQNGHPKTELDQLGRLENLLQNVQQNRRKQGRQIFERVYSTDHVATGSCWGLAPRTKV